MATELKPKAGLEDVVAADSAICYLDGEHGVLAYRGYDIHDLATHATFEEVCYLLWHGRLPNRSELGELQSQLAAARALPEGILRLMRSLPPDNAMDTMRTLVSALSHYDPDVADTSPQARYRTSVRLTAQLGTVVAMSGRLAAAGGLIAPDPVLGHAANFLYMLTGDRPSALAARALDIAGPAGGSENGPYVNQRRPPNVSYRHKRGTAEQWIKEGKQAAHWTRLSCHRFRANESIGLSICGGDGRLRIRRH